MSLSSNCVIHLTQTLESLLGILKESFYVRYCKEEFDCGTLAAGAKFPMVSFCDIPLSEIKDHIEKYGNYGIGLSKDWAKKNGLNPVLYFEKDSLVSKSLSLLFDELYSKNTEASTDIINSVVDILRYTKNYEGNLTRNNTTKSYRFSDEREWRFVPIIGACDNNVLEIDSKEKDVLKSNVKLTLGFEPKDIKYIIIKEDQEIENVIHCLKEYMGHFSHRDVERLSTRILTAEQIRMDI